MMKEAAPRKGRGKSGASKSARPPERVRAVRLIGAFMPHLTAPAFKRTPPLLIRLVMDWESLAGPALGRQSIPRRLSAGVLTVSCCGPAAMELQYAAPQLVERLNTACGLWGENRLRQIKIVQDRFAATAPEPVRRRPGAPIVVAEVEEGPLRDALERLGGQIAVHRRGKRR